MDLDLADLGLVDLVGPEDLEDLDSVAVENVAEIGRADVVSVPKFSSE